MDVHFAQKGNLSALKFPVKWTELPKIDWAMETAGFI